MWLYTIYRYVLHVFLAILKHYGIIGYTLVESPISGSTQIISGVTPMPDEPAEFVFDFAADLDESDFIHTLPAQIGQLSHSRCLSRDNLKGRFAILRYR